MEADPCNQLVNIKAGKIRGNNSNGPQKEDDKNLRKNQFVIGPCNLFYCTNDFSAFHKSKDINKKENAGCILKINYQKYILRLLNENYVIYCLLVSSATCKKEAGPRCTGVTGPVYNAGRKLAGLIINRIKTIFKRRN